MSRLAALKEQKVLKWGFDLTDIPAHSWQKVLNAVGVKGRPENRAHRWVWEAEGIKIVTGYDPITGAPGEQGKEEKPDHAGYIGLEGDPVLVKKAVALINQYGENDGDSPTKRNFV